MMLPSTYSAPVPARETEPETAAEATPRPELAPWVSPRALLLVGMAVLALAYVQRETRDAAGQPKPAPVQTELPKPAPTVPRDQGAPVGLAYVVTRASAYGCTATDVTVQIEAAIALGTSLKEIATARPELVAECVTLNVGEIVTTAWSGREHETLIRVRKAGERYVHWVPRRFLKAKSETARP
jgi:hypothetical protein